MRATLFTPDTERALRALAVFANSTENFYRPAPNRRAPGDDPRFVRHVVSLSSAGVEPIRVVFTITVDMNERRWRHLSISMGLGGRWPNEAVLFTIATMLGFTGGTIVAGTTVGPGADWMGGPHQSDRSYVVAQRVPDVT